MTEKSWLRYLRFDNVRNTTRNKRPKVLYHKLGSSFGGHRYLKSRLVVAILNFSKITCTSPYSGECDCKIGIMSDSFVKFLRPQKN